MLEFLTSKVDFSGINEPWLDMTKSGTSLMSKAANTMLQSKLSEFFTHGNFDGAVNANGVYQYLVDVAQKVMGKFPTYSNFWISSRRCLLSRKTASYRLGLSRYIWRSEIYSSS